MGSRKFITLDGNEAAASVAHRLSEVIAIYPITPSSPMGEFSDEWSTLGRKNIWGTVPQVTEMQSEAGAAGAVHGALQAGALTTTFTASQGLLLMIPNMFKIAGELTPFTMHVTARTIATHALSIFGDHSDVMACRQTGFAMLCSDSVQEAQDFACIAHTATLKSRIPFLHFFDGFRTSHEVAKIEALSDDDLRAMISDDLVKAVRERALTPDRPVIRGTAQNPDTFFQAREACNRFYTACPDIVQDTMDQFAKLTGRQYKLFNYSGDPQADRVIVIMGSGTETAEETAQYLNAKGEKVGVLSVKLYRPFSIEHFIDALPKTVKSIAVLDRTKEPGAPGDPLYLDVVTALREARDAGRSAFAAEPRVIAGRYGLSSKEFTPAMVKAVFEELAKPAPKNHFTVGIVDDVTHTSLDFDEEFDIESDDTVRAVFFGLGADGTVGANKNSIKIIGEETDNYAQGYFVYDSKKSGAMTISHLRFGPRPIAAPYLIRRANFVACHQFEFLEKFDVLDYARPGAVFLLNAPFGPEEVWDKLPREAQQVIVDRKLKFYTIDAVSVARDTGMGGRINTIMQAAFFKVAGIIPEDEAIDYMKQAVKKTYGKKGDKIVQMNWDAIDMGAQGVQEIKYPESWATTTEGAPFATPPADADEFFVKTLYPIIEQKGDDLPVSAFDPRGFFPTGTTKYEKRGIAVNVPRWLPENCIMCNQCSYVCPHAVIRPFLAKEEDLKDAPAEFITKDARGKDVAGYKFRMQISPLDCTGCGNCADICPAKEKALVMVPLAEEVDVQHKNWEFAIKLPRPDVQINKTTVIGSQYAQPLFEFSGACAGCGETPYIKLITQLFGDRMLIANATGCSSIYGGNTPTCPYTKNEKGWGPAWANSLFEDNAEFGYGMNLAIVHRRARLKETVRQALEIVSGDLKEKLAAWLENANNGEKSKECKEALMAILPDAAAKATGKEKELLDEILANEDLLIKKSIWIIGGDGWAYDIGYGGLDHVIAMGEDVNILVLDTEVYSNTGGQASKSTPTGSVAKFAAAGKRTKKKDLGAIAMTYGYVYVAQVAMGANHSQLLKALLEAESYEGPSLIIAYAPCINHGINMGKTQAEMKRAVESGYWHLYRYNPKLKEEGKNPFILDSKEPTASFQDFINSEIRYQSLAKQFPEEAEKLFAIAEKEAKERYAYYKKLAEG